MNEVVDIVKTLESFGAKQVELQKKDKWDQVTFYFQALLGDIKKIETFLATTGFSIAYANPVSLWNGGGYYYSFVRPRSSVGPEQLASTQTVAGSSPAGGTILENPCAELLIPETMSTHKKGGYYIPPGGLMKPFKPVAPPPDIPLFEIPKDIDDDGPNYEDHEVLMDLLDEMSATAKKPRAKTTAIQPSDTAFKLLELFEEGQRLASHLAEALEAKKDAEALIDEMRQRMVQAERVVKNLNDRAAKLQEELVEITRRSAELLNIKTTVSNSENKTANPLGRAVKLDEE